ncbi:hypothetical protein AKJ40_02815 [candidate division MSBL1 archaeon SCGC-AAA259M10]|uniref:Permease n=1 Tax=candidate division MSBL1 archaeon SCGC-AAA259M10 TaxID=1698270 RepID=A0A133UZE2_9EURY|nr:hypothetical protein AKJ40_02815 [candidate division MSBL1 archaeon SCGC-AAA259M10]
MVWEIIIGRNWSQRAIILGTFVLYIYMFLVRRDDAKKGLKKGLNTFKGLLTLIFAAILLASAIRILLPTNLVKIYLGPESGFSGVITGGLLGGIMQGGPYAVYPIIRGLQQTGVSLAIVIAMMVGYGAIGTGKIVYGLAFFNTKTISIRVAVGIGLTTLASIILYLLFL